MAVVAVDLDFLDLRSVVDLLLLLLRRLTVALNFVLVNESVEEVLSLRLIVLLGSLDLLDDFIADLAHLVLHRNVGPDVASCFDQRVHRVVVLLPPDVGVVLREVVGKHELLPRRANHLFGGGLIFGLAVF